MVREMAQLWGGRFTKKTDDQVFDFNASLSFDLRLLEEDIEGSVAHATMLGDCGILTAEELVEITGELRDILAEYKAGELQADPSYEDVHSFVEATLTQRIGEAGKKLHTGRSRNDQVATDMKLFARKAAVSIDKELYETLSVLEKLIEGYRDTVMPGFTHMQKAQPVVLGHHLNAYFEMFRRDRERIASLVEHMGGCPLGAGALAGTTYPLDRHQTAKLLGFKEPMRNSMDAVSDRDYLLEMMSDLSIIMMHLSRFCEEIITWNSDEYGFITLDDAYSTGSSIMPQKKNPDIAELIRGKCGRVYGDLMGLLTTMKSLPLAYNKDMQEDKEPAFDAIDTTRDCLNLFAQMLRSTTFHPEKMEKSASGGFTNATDVADYLVGKGVAFREAHSISGRLVLYCIDQNMTLGEIPLDVYKTYDEHFEEDIYDAISLESVVNRRNTLGGPGKEAMAAAIKANQEYLKETKPDVYHQATDVRSNK